jgi:hypothetical protein
MARAKSKLTRATCLLVLVLPIVVAIRAAVDAACGIAKAQFAASFVVSAARAELRTVKRGKESAAAGLPCNGSECVLRGGWSSTGVLRWISYAGSCAAIRKANQHAAELIDGDVVKVEQVAAWITAALVPDAAALHWV